MGNNLYKITVNSQEFTIPLQDKINGIYFIKVITKQKTIIKKILITN
jgi:hypothetical protein